MANRLNLMLHSGAKSATREQVENCNTPNGTDTWCPIPHSRLINLMVNRLDAYGMEIVQESHGLFKDGNRYFGIMQVAPKGGDGASLSDDFALVLGLRNSHDKSFPAGLCLGSGVFVCDNLAFSAEVVVGRKHTKYIEFQLPALIGTAMGKLMNNYEVQNNRLQTYKETELNNAEAHDLIINAMRQGAINTTRVPKVVEQWHKPNHPEFKERTVWSLFNSFTEVYKETSLVELPNRSTRLHGLLDAACGLSPVAA